jgi:DNA-nicking Smr family endonuclease
MESDDHSLFQKAMQNVKPLKLSTKASLKKPRTKPIKHASQAGTKPKPSYALSNPWDTNSIQPETCLSYGLEKLQHKQRLALKQGKIPLEARLDLHGFRLEEASTHLVRFIHHAYKNNQRMLLIIHGKGHTSILKTHVDHWLKELPEVLAFHSARLHHGGTGALYVLLTRH